MNIIKRIVPVQDNKIVITLPEGFTGFMAEVVILPYTPTGNEAVSSVDKPESRLGMARHFSNSGKKFETIVVNSKIQ